MLGHPLHGRVARQAWPDDKNVDPLKDPVDLVLGLGVDLVHDGLGGSTALVVVGGRELQLLDRPCPDQRVDDQVRRVGLDSRGGVLGADDVAQVGSLFFILMRETTS